MFVDNSFQIRFTQHSSNRAEQEEDGERPSQGKTFDWGGQSQSWILAPDIPSTQMNSVEAAIYVVVHLFANTVRVFHNHTQLHWVELMCLLPFLLKACEGSVKALPKMH